MRAAGGGVSGMLQANWARSRHCEINRPPKIMPSAIKKWPGKASPRTVAPIMTAHIGT